MGRKTTGSAQKKMMASSSGRKGKGKRRDTGSWLSNRPPPTTITGLPIYRVDNGSLVCRRCHEGDKYHHGHHRTCPKSRKYDGPTLRPTSTSTKSGPTFTAAEKCTRIRKPRHNDVLRFVHGIKHQAAVAAAAAAKLPTVAKVSLPAGFKFVQP